MKKIMKKGISILTIMVVALSSCDQNDDVNNPKPATSGNDIKANFLGINAIADGGAIDFYVNGTKVLGYDAATPNTQSGYSGVQIQTGFSGTNAIANTSIRAKATSGSIGGILGANDIIFRAPGTQATTFGTGINNLIASANANYTLILADSLNRPIPQRLFSINPATNVLAADLTYYNRANGKQISNDDYKALGTTNPSAQARCVSLGVINAGTTDPGGPRFVLLTDAFLTFPANNTTQSQIRFVNAVPNAVLTPAPINVNTRISARLKPAAGSNISLASNAEYVLSTAAGFSPSMGPRATTVPFVLQNTAVAGTATVYTLELSTDSFATILFSLPNLTFNVGKIYTIVAKGNVGKTGNAALNAVVAQHN